MSRRFSASSSSWFLFRMRRSIFPPPGGKIARAVPRGRAAGPGGPAGSRTQGSVAGLLARAAAVRIFLNFNGHVVSVAGNGTIAARDSQGQCKAGLLASADGFGVRAASTHDRGPDLPLIGIGGGAAGDGGSPG